MERPFFEPWHGISYSKYRTVIMSESTYDWPVKGKWHTAKPDHPRRSVEQAIDQEDNAQYFERLTRALCRNEYPTYEERKAAWNNFAYTIYVQQSVGRGAGARPKRSLWEESREIFPTQICSIRPRPRKLIVTGKEMWNRMPECERMLVPDIQAYKFYGELLWCLALPHPANRVQGEGFDWRRVGESISTFLETKFPTV